MAKIWIRTQGQQTETAASTLSLVKSIYQNSRSVTGNITLVQKATVVATYLFGVTDTDDTWSMTLIVDDETTTITLTAPETVDPQVKGMYIFSRGPLLYQPKRLISIPVESELSVRINKEVGGATSVLKWHMGFLLNTSL